MEEPEDRETDEPQTGSGEDHRQGPPGYDLDEQEAIEKLEKEREQGES